MIRRIAVPPFEALDPLLPRRAGSDASTRETVAGILDDVLLRGDEAVREYTRRLDGVDLPPSDWELHAVGWRGALDRIEPGLRAALALAVDRVREYHQHQRTEGFRLTDEDGSVVGMKVTPLDRVGLYVPGGKASYPSSVVMNAVPALVAGVPEIVAVVPPQGVTDMVLAACALAGVTRIFRIGGAQAVAALAFGTATVPRVDKIVGPGNRWVAEAKRQVAGQVGIDMVAGPTEILIIADRSASPARIAADLIAQAEHDEDAVGWCVTTHAAIADALPAALEAALAAAPRAAIARAALERNGLVIVVPDMRDAIEVANRRAPEHLEILAEGAERIVGERPARRRHLPGRLYPGAGRRLHRRAQPRAPHRRNRPPLVPARGLRLRQANQHHRILAGAAGRRRRRDHRAGGGGGTVRARGGGENPPGRWGSGIAGQPTRIRPWR